MSALDARLLAAHASGDLLALTALYSEAAEQAKTDVAERFFLTQAYVYALESCAPEALSLRNRLVTLGSEPG